MNEVNTRKYYTYVRRVRDDAESMKYEYYRVPRAVYVSPALGRLFLDRTTISAAIIVRW